MTKYTVDDKGNARVDFELERGGGVGHFVDELIQRGEMGELSLQHLKCCHDACCSRSTLVPVEVSVCKQGARPNSRISRLASRGEGGEFPDSPKHERGVRVRI